MADYEGALPYAERSVKRYYGLSAMANEAAAYALLIQCLVRLDRRDLFDEHLDPAIQVIRWAGARRDLAFCLHLACMRSVESEDYSTALEHSREFHRVVVSAGLESSLPTAVTCLAECLRLTGDLREARSVATDAVELAGQHNDSTLEGKAMRVLVRSLFQLGDHGEVARVLPHALELAVALSDADLEAEFRQIRERLES